MSDQEAGNWDFVIHAYTLEMALADGVLFEFAKEQWPTMTGGRPVVVTAALREQFDDATLGHVFNDYVSWIRNTRDSLPEEEQMYETSLGNIRIWVIDDGTAVTILSPHEY